MKVANITEEGRWGGPQVRIVNVASRLRDRGVETVVVHPTHDASRFVRELNEKGGDHCGISLHRLTKHLPTLLKYVVLFVSEIVDLCHALEKKDVDLVHCNGCWQIKGMIAANLMGIPAVWHLNDTHVPAPIRWGFNKTAPFLADGYIFASNRTQDYYFGDQKSINHSFEVIQAPVNTDEFDPEEVQSDAEFDQFDGLRVVTVATVNPLKGLEDFIDMATAVTRRVSQNVRFFIVGPIYESQKRYGEELKKQVKELDADNIYFTGRSDNVPGILKAADLYVCSSKFEASPISVWEAMSMALPIVSTDVGDIRDFLENEDSLAGSVVEVGNADDMAEQVIHFLNHPSERKRAGRKAREIAKNELNIDVCVHKHHRIYSEVLGVPDTYAKTVGVRTS